MEIWLTLLGGILGIVGAFAGAWFGNQYERRARKFQAQKDTTISLYTEFHSAEMIKARIRVRNLLSGDLKRDPALSLNQIREIVSPEDWYNFSLVVTFFEKFGVYLQNNYLDKDLVRNLLEGDFTYWYNKCLSSFVIDGDMLQSSWSRSIGYINEWFHKYRAASGR